MKKKNTNPKTLVQLEIVTWTRLSGKVSSQRTTMLLSIQSTRQSHVKTHLDFRNKPKDRALRN